MPSNWQFFGDLTNELAPGQFMREFSRLVDLANLPNIYYSNLLFFQVRKFCACQTSDMRTAYKIRGFTLNGMTKHILNFKSMLSMLTAQEPVDVTYPVMLKRAKRHFELEQDDQKKRFAVTYDKRRIVDIEWHTLPFGYGLK